MLLMMHLPFELADLLREMSAKYSSVLRTCSDAIWWLWEENRLEYANQREAFFRMLGTDWQLVRP